MYSVNVPLSLSFGLAMVMNICMLKFVNAHYKQCHLVPCVQQHDIILTEVVLRELGHLGHVETARLIGAFKQAWLVV